MTSFKEYEKLKTDHVSAGVRKHETLKKHETASEAGVLGFNGK
jgi:hypothetical protein